MKILKEKIKKVEKPKKIRTCLTRRSCRRSIVNALLHSFCRSYVRASEFIKHLKSIVNSLK